MLERDLYLSTLSQLGTVTGIYWGQMTFDTELRGSGSIPTAAAQRCARTLCSGVRAVGIVLCGRVCGLQADQQFPDQYWNRHNVHALRLPGRVAAYRHRLHGQHGVECAGRTVRQVHLDHAGAVGVIDLQPATITDDGIRDATFPASPVYQGILAQTAQHCWGRIPTCKEARCVQALTFNMNNNVVRRDCMGAPSGVAGFMITSRKPGGTVNPNPIPRASGTVPNNDVWGKWRNNVGGLSAFNAGVLVGNQIS